MCMNFDKRSYIIDGHGGVAFRFHFFFPNGQIKKNYETRIQTGTDRQAKRRSAKREDKTKEAHRVFFDWGTRRGKGRRWTDARVPVPVGGKIRKEKYNQQCQAVDRFTMDNKRESRQKEHRENRSEMESE